ncbi:MAG: DUF1924 domain-containing protein [Magnetococcales bacterium]|nr:DUF1924 domain-containing protein [Magnetococcales bacterium]
MRSIMVVIGLLLVPALAGAATLEGLLSGYRSAGAGPFLAERGAELLVRETSGASEGASCAACHTRDPRQPGRHVKTGKPIEPLAPAVNPERLTDPAKVEKWFLRNCKGTLGRVCTPQEKGDFLQFLSTLR